MITTRDYRETIIARLKRDREFARLFYAGAVEMLLEGDSAGASPDCAIWFTPKSPSKNWRAKPAWEKSLFIGCSIATATPRRATWG